MSTPLPHSHLSQNSQTAKDGGFSPISRVIVAIATTGRKSIVSETIARIHLQNRLPDLLVLSIADESDIDTKSLENLPFPCEVKIGLKGVCNQRNQVLSLLEPDDILLFTDDDFLLQPDYLENLVRLFQSHSGVVMATGDVLEDGILGAGYSHSDGDEFLAQATDTPRDATIVPVYNGYGCNMAMRARPILENTLRFDEVLPMYSWLEDVDFSRQLSAFGEIVRSNQIRGVHLGTKMGRASGKFLGYSQIANPLYLVNKGTMSRGRAYRIMGRNILANIGKSIRPEPWVDRKGRVCGNALAYYDLIRGKLSPTRVLRF